jgi:hypothetical protein
LGLPDLALPDLGQLKHGNSYVIKCLYFRKINQLKSHYFWKKSSKGHAVNLDTQSARAETATSGRVPNNLLKREDIALEVRPTTFSSSDNLIVQDIENC